MKKAVIFDFNDTLRNKSSGTTKKNILNKALKEEKKEHVIILSGEESNKKYSTKKWLNRHGLDKVELDVRPEGNTESDPKEKEHELKKISKQFDVVKAYDDKEKNIKMFKKHGIKTKEV
jgi:FMN phosphatase YigB (HAD superfamily)